MSRNPMIAAVSARKAVGGMAGFGCHGTLTIGYPSLGVPFEEWPAFDVTEQCK